MTLAILLGLMFDRLTEKLQRAFKNLTGRGKPNEAAVDEGLREIRLALLDADVNFKAVKELLDRVREPVNGRIKNYYPYHHL